MKISQWLAARRADGCALAVIILFFAGFFGPVLWRGQFLIAGDAYYQSYPLRTIAWDMIRRGELPLWTPFVFSGYPLLSMAQVAIAYPLTWGYLFLPGHWAEQVVVLAPFLLAPAFTYAYAREVGRSRLAALLAGLVFTYGGNMSSKMGGLGIMANPEMWLPLFLLAIERARRGNFARCLLGATAAYMMSVLAGQAQAFLLVGMVALAYALFVTLFAPSGDASGQTAARSWWRWLRWQPLAVAGGAILLAVGVAAFQILETMRVVRRSVRSSLSFETFSAGAFTPTEALRSFVAPLYHYIEVSTYVAPLAALLALFAIAKAVSQRYERSHIYFWLSTALVACVLMLGDSTPLYRLLHHVPVFNLFRYPSRHAFEWTFAISLLAAYGWDALSDALARKRALPARTHTRTIVVGWLLFAASLLLALFWWRDARARPRASNFGLDSGLIPSLPEHHYLLWKLAFTIVITLLVWCALKITMTRGRDVLLVCAVALACFVEPRIFCAHVWFPYARTSEQFSNVPPVERFLQQHPAETQRVYTRVNLFVRGYWTPPALDLPNMTAPRGLQNVAGYEQLILARYSRALGNAGPDAVNRRDGGAPDETLFASNSHVLDLLNTAHVVTFAHLATMPEALTMKDGVPFAETDLARGLQPGETTTLDSEAATGDTLALVTSLANSTDVADEQLVARLRIFTADGAAVERSLRAGTDTAEWAHERADVRAAIKHRLAPVFDRTPGDAANSYPANRYWTRSALGARVQVQRVEITNVAPHALLSLWKATVYDSVQPQQATTLAGTAVKLDPARWQAVFRRDGVVVWRNGRAQPRAWLVAEAEAVDGEDALRRIRGEGERAFDPLRTALLEDSPAELPHLPGGELSPGSTARLLNFEPNRMIIETDAPTDTLLVVSEIFYPGWIATVDEQPARIHLTDFLLRGVALPAGHHRVELRYTAPAARNGAIISALTLLLLTALLAYTRRAGRAGASAGELAS